MKDLHAPFSKYIAFAFFLIACGTLSPAQTFTFDGIVDGTTGTLNNGWVGFPTTGYRWEANAGGTPSGGTGPTQDHTLQTPAGIYMYVEATSPAAVGDTAVLTSPDLILSSFTNPGFQFFYHKFGAGMGDLYIDVFDGTTWNRGVDSIIGAVQSADGDPYLAFTVNLAPFSDTVQVRFRAVYGSSFTGDMAIDGVSLVELPQFDLNLSGSTPNPSGYRTWPLSQSPTLTFSGDLTNQGVDSITNATFKVTVGTFADSASVASLAPGATANLSTSMSFTPPATGDYTVNYNTFGDQIDTVTNNNDETGLITINDSIYARDDSTFSGSLGIGAGTVGVLGQTFEITTTDTLTSVSFWLNGPIVGDTTWVDLYDFTTTPNNILAASDTLIIPSATGAWYTLSFPCGVVLTPGTYFLGVNELGQNISLGTNTNFFTPNTGWVIFGNNPWLPSEDYNFNVNYLLRMNLGTPPSSPDLIQDTTICSNASVTYSLPADYSNFLWNGIDTSSTFTTSSAGTITVSATSAAGCTETDSVNVGLFPLPSAGQGGSTVVCATDPGFDLNTVLAVQGDSTGTWNDDDNTNGLSASTFNPGVPGQGVYNFTYQVTDSCGLTDSTQVTVTVDLPPNAGTTGSGVVANTGSPLDLFPLLNGSPMTGGTWVDLDGSGGLTGSNFDPSSVAPGTYNFAYIITNGCSSDTGIVQVQVTFVVGLNAVQDLSFRAWPNPSQGAIHLEIPAFNGEALQIRVLDLAGKMVYQDQPQPAAQLDLDLKQLPKGVYLIEVQQGVHSGRQRLIFQ